jgi:hypothetical protein
MVVCPLKSCLTVVWWQIRTFDRSSGSSMCIVQSSDDCTNTYTATWRPVFSQFCCWCEWILFCTSSEKSVFTRECQTRSTRSRTIIYRSCLMITLYQPPDNCMINIELYSNISWAHTSIWHSNGLPSFSNCKFTSCHTQL